MKKNLQFFMLAILLAASSFAAAQTSTIRSTPSSPGLLLNRKDVQDDLKLSTQVRDKIKSIWSDILKSHGAEQQGNGFVVRGGTPGGGGMGDLGKEMTEKAVPLLTAAQKTRLEQIRIQLGGPRIAMDPAVKSKIGLTSDQEAKIKKLVASEQDQVNDTVKAAGGRVDQTVMGELKAIKSKTDAAIGKELTKTQKDKLKELGGAPFKPQA